MSANVLELKNFLIFGAARSGLAAARLLKSMGKTVAVYDEAPAEKIARVREELQTEGIPMLAAQSRENLNWGELNAAFDANTKWQALVLSPGITPAHPLVQLAEKNNCQVRSEIEIGFLACPAAFAGITGTNGKTTVTHLMSHILQHAGRVAPMAGNVGFPLCDVVRDSALKTPEAAVVCELSSYQLETIETFRPKTACVLNLTPDHLERYGNMENYAAAKLRITLNQQPDDTLVLNADDAFCREMAKKTRAQVLWISVKGPVEQGAYLAGNDIYLVMEQSAAPIRVMQRSDIPVPGLHNVENVLACVAMCASLGVPLEAMAQAVSSFQAVPHRIEWIAKIDGVDYYNDSKATNLDSVEKALASFNRPVLLIAGGRDKGAPWTQLNALVAKHVKGLVLIGEAAEIGRAAWGGIVPRVEMASDMEDAVRRCRAMASEDDVVLLSPACASFDMYKNFEERGEHFRKIVKAMTN